ncbi:hypothetical protein [Salininema proteolyticum]|uniref:Uncharacterized protein n=1 Tax=Salininema proteolyticum TaxID=1607685 RepID=A0ABV8U288_9ACTN
MDRDQTTDSQMIDFQNSENLPQQGGFGEDWQGDNVHADDGALYVLDQQGFTPNRPGGFVNSALMNYTKGFVNDKFDAGSLIKGDENGWLRNKAGDSVNNYFQKGEEFYNASNQLRDQARSGRYTADFKLDWDGIKNTYGKIKTDVIDADQQSNGALKKWGLKNLGFDPLQFLVGTLVDFLISTFQPLEDVLGVVTGNESRMKTSAEMWKQAGDAMDPIADHIQSIVDAELSDWDGQAAENARARVLEMSLLVSGMGYLTAVLNGILSMAATVAKAIRGYVEDLIAQGVSWVIKSILPSVASAIATFGATTPAIVAMVVVKIAALVFDAIQAVQEAIRIFQKFMDLIQMVQELMQIFGPYIAEMINIPDMSLGITKL